MLHSPPPYAYALGRRLPSPAPFMPNFGLPAPSPMFDHHHRIPPFGANFAAPFPPLDSFGAPFNPGEYGPQECCCPQPSSEPGYTCTCTCICTRTWSINAKKLCNKLGGARLLLMEFNGQSKRDGKDDAIQEGSNDRNSSGDVDEFDPWTAWLYKPRTVSLLLVGACFLIWASGALNPDSTASTASVSSVRRGVWAMIAVFLTYCVLQAPSTLLIRPHPAVWRFFHGMAVVYLVALTFLLFQNRDDARQFMKYLHPDLGVELPERSYGADC